jgi:hypothetical protein
LAYQQELQELLQAGRFFFGSQHAGARQLTRLQSHVHNEGKNNFVACVLTCFQVKVVASSTCLSSCCGRVSGSGCCPVIFCPNAFIFSPKLAMVPYDRAKREQGPNCGTDSVKGQ